MMISQFLEINFALFILFIIVSEGLAKLNKKLDDIKKDSKK